MGDEFHSGIFVVFQNLLAVRDVSTAHAYRCPLKRQALAIILQVEIVGTVHPWLWYVF